ncbi:MAG TPA: hypothetical protein VER75_08765 [Thermoleophilaceae bacterium]|nr:hypothetical protein [Thermoleophilaceae bacterium]
MPGLRLLLRMAPFFVGALAAAVWLRRRQADRLALAPPPAVPELEAPRPRTGRFDSEPRHEPIDIVTVVDDLLAIGL